MQKTPRHAAVSRVSHQPKFPAPKTIRTICARNKYISKEIGTMKKIIWQKEEEKLFKNLSFRPATQARERTEKEEIAKGIPISPTGTY